MITRRTKVQLIIFALITVLGVSFVGARYARLDRLFIDDSYVVAAHFAESGGIFEGAGVSYRGVTVGRVAQLRLTDEGVDVMLEIDNDSARIPEDAKALVANRSAVGEQYVDLLPQTDEGPYLEEGSEIPLAMTETPIPTTKFLVDIDSTVNSVDKRSLRTVVSELGDAFQGTGEDLGQIIDTSNSFIRTANDNFKLTTTLLEDSNVVLGTQLDKASAIRSFSSDLSKFSDTLVSSDADLRRVIDNGSATANQLRTFLEENDVDLGELINNLVTTGEVTARHVDGTEMILVVYPYVVAGGYTVVGKDSTGLYDAHFGLITQQSPVVCHQGYQSTDTRPPSDRDNRPMNESARCTEAQAASNARGAQNAPRGRAGTAYRAPVVAEYDRATGQVEYADDAARHPVTYTGGAEAVFGKDSWKWLLLQPLAEGR
ncbi:MCE family protein [Nocardioides mesophilus]|uniref:MCE family protein n=1 Tax=Nocardioides mesophilus TaxID=433659 RepID=A0A7G9R6Z2_9ACTN|nr:MlaD family protein [Nocardioides mesophilus]QNN51367.1 MCE family protein [Nocardioides mesophilus]